MASFSSLYSLMRRRSAVLRAVAATIFVVGAAGTCSFLLSGCGMSAAHAQSVSQPPPMAVTSPPVSIASLQDSSATQALLHQANTSYHAHDWLGALIDYQQIYYLDSEDGRPDDRGLGSFAQARMSLCHTWTGVNALQQGDYATSKSEFSAALDDNDGNTVAQRLLTRCNQQYHLLTAVQDVRQPMSDVGDAPDEQAALNSIQASSSRNSSVLAGLTNGTARQRKAAFRFLQAYDDAFVTNFLLTHDIASQEAVTQDIALSPTQHAPSDDEIIYDVEQMVKTYPEISDMGQAAFANDDIAEAAQYQPVLAAERNQLEEDNEAIANDPTGEENFLWETRHQEGRGAEMQLRQLLVTNHQMEAQEDMKP